MTVTGIQERFLIRDYGDGDYEKVVKFWELIDLNYPDRRDTREIIETTINLGGKLIIMEENGTGLIAGTSWMTFDGRRIMLHHFGILPQLQGKGLSKILLRKSLDFVKLKNCQVKLEVLSTNLKAINLYRKFGFRHLGEYKVYIIRDLSIL